MTIRHKQDYIIVSLELLKTIPYDSSLFRDRLVSLQNPSSALDK